MALVLFCRDIKDARRNRVGNFQQKDYIIYSIPTYKM
jgi:hypothetical protein